MAQKKSVRKVVKDFAEETSTHGIRYIILRKSVTIRMVWFILFGLSSGFFIYQTHKLLSAYYNRPTLISIEKKAVKAMKFPSITICKGSTLSRSAGVQEHISLRQPAFIQHFLSFNHLLGFRAFLASEYTRQFHTLEDAKKAAGNPHNLFLTKLDSSCIFGIHEYCSYPINISDVITSSYGGICYEFNQNGQLRQRHAGSYFGLTMIMFVNQSDFVPFTTIDFGSGIILSLHDSGEFSFPDLNGIPISPGVLTRISLKKTIYKRLKDPYPSNCSDGKNVDLLYPGSYTISNCKRSCLVRDSLKSCGSSDPLTMMLLNQTGKYKYKPINDTTQQCIINAAIATTSQNLEKCMCPVPCTEVEYAPTISQTKWPSQADLPLYKQLFAYALGVKTSDLTDDFVYNNFLQVNIYFDEMSYQDVLEKREWTAEKLISDIGGQIGVWIGASVLSLFEIAFFIVKLLRTIYSKRKKKNKKVDPKCKPRENTLPKAEIYK